ncbi:MAG: 3-isopropylmalate dehydratase large subunit [Candidatus Omnitrophica bacterium]|nr:3-isopropylmalate dehydratase large subunit [Candidatus Omnitrophota bacterium]
MGMTLTEKILARAANRSSVCPGETVWVKADVLMTHDVCGPPTIGIFHEQFGRSAKVWDREKVVIIPDHYIFTKDEKARRNVETLRTFAGEQRLPHYYDPGTKRYKGVCHIALAEEGHTRPGEVLFGTDSHTCTAGAFGEFATGIGNTEAAFVMGTGTLWLRVPHTLRFVFEGALPPYLMAKDLMLTVIGTIGVDGGTYKALEFDGDGVYSLSMEERMTLVNMTIEAGGKNGLINPDQVTINSVAAKTKKPFQALTRDADASYLKEYRFDCRALEPVVAKPSSPDHHATVRSVSGVAIDRAYLGSCTGGKLTDFLAAARVMNGRRVKVNTFVVPATTEIERALETAKIDGQTLKQIFEHAGCVIGPPSCGACLGGPLDTLGRLNEPMVCISSTSRNFPGRMGHKLAQVYLASPLTVAASAVRGVITDPREFLA